MEVLAKILLLIIGIAVGVSFGPLIALGATIYFLYTGDAGGAILCGGLTVLLTIIYCAALNA